MNAIEEFQNWYVSQCNEEWEHRYGVEIGTLDNPGWFLKIDLIDTPLQDSTFSEQSYGIDLEVNNVGDNWLVCKVEAGKFVCYGGPKKLEEMMRVFLSWSKTNT